VTVLGGAAANLLQGSLSPVQPVAFSNGSKGFVASNYVGADNITGGPGGLDIIYGDGGPDIITLPSHSQFDTIVFGEDFLGTEIGPTYDVLAVTDGSDQAYLGSWGAGKTPTAIPNLFSVHAGGTSADMTSVTGFDAGPGGDVLDFAIAAWDGASTGAAGFAVQGDLVILNGLFPIAPGAAQLSHVWVNSGSNSSLAASDDVLRYAPSDASIHSAQQLAEQLHTISDAVVLPGGIGPGKHLHLLVAYDAGNSAVRIADVDLVNLSGSPQSSTADLNVYASDMVHLVGVSLSGLTADNIHFI
jgi:hypothetical protein